MSGYKRRHSICTFTVHITDHGLFLKVLIHGSQGRPFYLSGLQVKLKAIKEQVHSWWLSWQWNNHMKDVAKNSQFIQMYTHLLFAF